MKTASFSTLAHVLKIRRNLESALRSFGLEGKPSSFAVNMEEVKKSLEFRKNKVKESRSLLRSMSLNRRTAVKKIQELREEENVLWGILRPDLK